MFLQFYLCFFTSLFTLSESSNHWIVTEEGRIKSQSGSPYDLRQSHDLIALLKQEQRFIKLRILRQELVHYKYQFLEILDLQNYFKAPSEQLHNPDCRTVKSLSLHDLTPLTVIPLEDKGISHHDFLDPAPPSKEPLCSHFSDLPFTMSSMAHLAGVQNKDSLNGRSELFLLLPFYLQMNEFGNSLHQGLQKNTTSWVLYNLAAIYWRVRGEPNHAIDCIQRALYYSPSQYHDIALLHLSNVLYLSDQIYDALIPLKAALSFSTSRGILFYTLGKIYANLGYLSESVSALETALYYKAQNKDLLSLRQSLLCNMTAQQIKHHHIEKIMDTKQLLHQFYNILSEAHRQSILESSNLFSNWINLLVETATYDPYIFRSNKQSHTRDKQTHSYARDKQTHSYASDKQTHSYTSDDLETLLKSAVEDITLIENKCDNWTRPLSLEISLKKILATQQNAKPKIRLVRERCHSNKSANIKICSHVISQFYPHPVCPVVQIKNHTHQNNTQYKVPAQKVKKSSKYTEAYRRMEFLPYTALPASLEQVIFPNHTPSSADDYNDPYWPTKTQCLELVEGLTDNLPRFTGTFLTPEARGISFKELLADIPLLSWQQAPYCTNITDLPFSMMTMDHLEGMANRDSLASGESVAEAGLKQLLVTAVEDATGIRHTVKEAAQRVMSALHKHGHHWGLFNLASVYWRAIGDGHQSIECLRLAIHYAPYNARDIGYIGLANVLHRHGYLDSAMVIARAALDIRPDSPIGHYTVAGVYLTSGNLVATNLHLRMALHLQPQFSHAYSALKLVRCSLKFKEEQKLLEQKQNLLLAQQELVKKGHDPTPENLQEALHNIVSQQKQDVTTINLAEDEAIKYLTLLSLTFRTASLSQQSKTVSPSPSLTTPSLTSSSHPSTHHETVVSSSRKKPQYTMEFMAKENEREEELRKKWPENLPWPTLDDCKRKPPPQYMVFTSTWLSVTAKKINITHYMDFKISITDYSLLPFCELNFQPSSITLDYLEGMNNPPLLDYIAERGLEEVLCKLSGTYTPMEEMATRMKLAMMKNDSNWVVSNLAALYWRIVGNGQQALKCLKHALHHAPPHNRDVGYVSLANVLYRSGYYDNAATSMQLALETSPNLVVNHFTMANILAAQNYYREAAGYYELVLYHQPEFGPASERLRAVRCMIVLGENKVKLKHLHEKNNSN